MAYFQVARIRFLSFIILLVLLALDTSAQTPIAFFDLPTAYPLSLKQQPAVSQEQIRNTMAHYPLAIDGKNFAALDLVFTQNAVANYSAPLGVLIGLPQIKAVIQQALAPVISQHALSTQVIEIEKGNRKARSVTYFTASQFGTGNKTGKVLYSYAQYQDSWVKVGDEEWRIYQRNLVYMVISKLGFANLFSSR